MFAFASSACSTPQCLSGTSVSVLISASAADKSTPPGTFWLSVDSSGTEKWWQSGTRHPHTKLYREVSLVDVSTVPRETRQRLRSLIAGEAAHV